MHIKAKLCTQLRTRGPGYHHSHNCAPQLQYKVFAEVLCHLAIMLMLSVFPMSLLGLLFDGGETLKPVQVFTEAAVL